MTLAVDTLAGSVDSSSSKNSNWVEMFSGFDLDRSFCDGVQSENEITR